MSIFSADVLRKGKSWLGGKSVRDPSGDTLGYPVGIMQEGKTPHAPWQSRSEMGRWSSALVCEVGSIGSHVSSTPVCQKAGFGN